MYKYIFVIFLSLFFTACGKNEAAKPVEVSGNSQLYIKNEAKRSIEVSGKKIAPGQCVLVKGSDFPIRVYFLPKGCAPFTFLISESANYRVSTSYRVSASDEPYEKVKDKNIEDFLKSCKSSNQISTPSDQPTGKTIFEHDHQTSTSPDQSTGTSSCGVAIP